MSRQRLGRGFKVISSFVAYLLFLAIITFGQAVSAETLPTLSLTIVPENPTVGDTIRVQVTVKDVQDLYGIEVHLRYNSNVLRPKPGNTKVSPGDPASPGTALFGGKKVYEAQNLIDSQQGTIDYTVALWGEPQGVSGSGAIFTTEFEVIAQGDTGFLLKKAKLVNSNANSIDITASIVNTTVKPVATGGGVATPPPAGSPPTSGATPPPAPSPTPSPAPSPSGGTTGGGRGGKTELKDIRGHWAEKYITKLAEMGIVSGFEDGTFRPEEPLTREQLVKLIVIALGLPETEYQEKTFLDVDPGRWSARYLATAFARGIITGYVEDSGRVFKPDAPVTRAELTAIVVRAKQIRDESSIPFRDVKSDHWALKFIKAAYGSGLVQGTSADTFEPDKMATRAHAATLILRLLGVKVD